VGSEMCIRDRNGSLRLAAQEEGPRQARGENDGWLHTGDVGEVDPETKLIFNSNGEGTVTAIHQDGPDKYSVVETVKTLPRAKTMALDPKTHQLFLSTAESGQFEVLVVGK